MATPTTINGAQIRVATIPRTAIDAPFQANLTGITNDVASVIATMSTDAETLAAINAVTSAWQAADVGLTSMIQGLVNATIAGAGLAANGSYTTPVTSNYLGAVTNLAGGLVALDTAIAAEATRATGAESGLQAQITVLQNDGSSAQALADEVAARIAADSALSTSVTAEVTRAQAAEAANATATANNATAIAAETTRAQGAEASEATARAAAVTAEASRAQAAEATLQTNISNLATLSATAADLATEVSRAQAAEAAEITARTAAVAAEATRATAAEALVASDAATALSAETLARTNADTAEATARAADST